MTKFDQAELLKIAKLSLLKLDSDQIKILLEQIKIVLDYTEELEKVKLSTEMAPIKNINVFREDEVIAFDYSPLLSQAPEKKETYFVVPNILEQKNK